MPRKHLLVVGATGVAGAAFIAEFLSARLPGIEGWKVTGLSRRLPDESRRQSVTNSESNPVGEIQFISADLLGDYHPLSALVGVTHVVFAGFVPAPDFASLTEPNTRILMNCLKALASQPLERIILIQGMKFYGSHLGPFKTPAREDDPRLDSPNYYYAQQDVLEDSGIDWVCLRPHVICGTQSLGTPQNILSVIGVYAALLKQQGKPLCWPGTEAAFHSINQASDARLLARCIGWSLIEPRAGNQAFNITNGDFFRWQYLWPRIADLFGMDTGPVAPQKLTEIMPGRASEWQEIVQANNLREFDMAQLAHWPFADYIFGVGWDVMASTVKVREHGFQECVDTESMYLEHFARLQREAVFPSP